MNFIKTLWNKILLVITVGFAAVVAYLGLENKKHLRKIKELDEEIDSLTKKTINLKKENEVVKKVDEVRANDTFNPSEFDK